MAGINFSYAKYGSSSYSDIYTYNTIAHMVIAPKVSSDTRLLIKEIRVGFTSIRADERFVPGLKRVVHVMIGDRDVLTANTGSTWELEVDSGPEDINSKIDVEYEVNPSATDHPNTYYAAGANPILTKGVSINGGNFIWIAQDTENFIHLTEHISLGIFSHGRACTYFHHISVRGEA